MSTARSGVATLTTISASRVATADGEYRLRQRLPHLAIDAADDAEVYERDDIARQDENVPRMRIGVKQAVPENLSEHRVGATAGDETRIQVGSLARSDRRHLDAIQELHRQNAGRAEWPADTREAHGRIAGELRRDTLDEASFADEILFAANRPGELVHQIAQAVQSGVGDVSLSQ